jgi:hypothetical protein
MKEEQRGDQCDTVKIVTIKIKKIEPDVLPPA